MRRRSLSAGCEVTVVGSGYVCSGSVEPVARVLSYGAGRVK